MNQAGIALLAIVALASLAGLMFPLFGERRRSPLWTRIGHMSIYAVLGGSVAAMLLLLAAFLSNDFSNAYVYGHSSRALSAVYTISALWAGNAGSLLLWLLLLAIFATIACRRARRRDPGFAGIAVAVLSAMTLFFSLLLLFGPECDPFAPNAVTPTPTDGLGLNPQLENPGMIIHPLALYAGYVALAVPFALMIAGLVKRLPTDSWLTAVRAWVLTAWLFLTIGNVVGAWWAYVSLGWGGYWAWDPVENASLIPWLTATALLHAVSISRRKNTQKQWMGWLLAVTFLLTVFGTFLTRTGVASSVHAFEDSGLIPWFVVFMVVMLVLAVAVLVWRRALLRSATTTGSLVDEPGTFLYANIILSVLTFVILWGVVFPPIANAVSSSTIEFSTDFFNLVSAPLGLLLMAVLVVCMLARVRRGSWRRFTIDIAIAVGVGIVVLAVLLALGVTKPFPVAAFALSAMAIAAVVIATLRTGLGWKRRRSYGAMLIHLGLAILIVGVAGSWAYKTTTDGQLAPGQTLTLGGAQVTLVQIDESQGADRETTSAVLDLTLDGKPAGRLVPRLEYYPASDQNWTRVAMRSSVTGDIYVLLQGADAEQNTVSVELESHPLIVWLWVGGAVMALGGLVALVLGRRPAGPKGPAAGGAGSKGASSRKQAAGH